MFNLQVVIVLMLINLILSQIYQGAIDKAGELIKWNYSQLESILEVSNQANNTIIVKCIVSEKLSQLNSEQLEIQIVTFIHDIIIGNNNQCESWKTNLIESPLDRHYPLWTAHFWINMICWGFLIDIGIIIARYGKIVDYRIEVHSILMSTIVLPSLIAEGLMIFGSQRPEEQHQIAVSAHDVIGFIFLSLMVLQCLSGIFVRMGILSDGLINNLKIRSQIHYFCGHAIYLIGKIQLGIGIYIVVFKNEKNTLIGFWVLYIVVFLWRIILESLYINGGIMKLLCLRNRSIKDDALSESQMHRQQMINYIETNEQQILEQEYKTTLWCIFNNTVIDLTQLVHPGGQFIWNAVRGREICRFLYGAYALETSSIPPYKHSVYAFELIKLNVIGQLTEIPFYYQKDNLKASLISEDLQNNSWVLRNVYKLTDDIAQFGFHNTNMSLRTHLTGLNSCGRYFLVSSRSNSTIDPRPYTMVLCTSQPNVQFRIDLEIYLLEQLQPQLKSKQILTLPSATSELPLIIKHYSTPNGLSQYIHNHIQEEYMIQGPFGTSFGIPKEGKVVIICGGTGLLPFLDLLDYFYKYTIYEILKNKVSQQSADYSNVTNQKFNELLHITLVLAVQSEKDLLYKDIYFNMQKHQQYLENPNFRMIIKSKHQIVGVDTITDRFDAQLFKTLLSPLEQYSRFLVCGPPVMNKQVPRDLISLGINDQLIHLV